MPEIQLRILLLLLLQQLCQLRLLVRRPTGVRSGLEHDYLKEVFDLLFKHSEVLAGVVPVSHGLSQGFNHVIHSIDHFDFQLSSGVLLEGSSDLFSELFHALEALGFDVLKGNRDLLEVGHQVLGAGRNAAFGVFTEEPGVLGFGFYHLYAHGKLKDTIVERFKLINFIEHSP